MPVSHHLLLCATPSKALCCPDPAIGAASWATLKRLVRELGLEDPARPGGIVLRTKADCLRVCAEGPVLLIWPDGVVYGGVTPDRWGMGCAALSTTNPAHSLKRAGPYFSEEASRELSAPPCQPLGNVAISPAAVGRISRAMEAVVAAPPWQQNLSIFKLLAGQCHERTGGNQGIIQGMD